MVYLRYHRNVTFHIKLARMVAPVYAGCNVILRSGYALSLRYESANKLDKTECVRTESKPNGVKLITWHIQ
jgi:hypothetical protein